MNAPIDPAANDLGHNAPDRDGRHPSGLGHHGPEHNGLDQLSEKEKDVLRLITRGHDAKSCAGTLGLSVHTINDRLRTVRRKLGVTSSREAARRLFKAEQKEAGPTRQNLARISLGDAKSSPAINPDASAVTSRGALFWIGGLGLMLSLALVAALFSPALTPAIAPTTALATPSDERRVGDPATPVETTQLREWKRTALAWLALVDQSDWDASFSEAGASFQKLNTVAGWRDASLQARVPLGAVVNRHAVNAGFVNAPPHGYVIMEFQSDFEARAGAVEKVTLEKEGGLWKVVGYVIE